MFLREPFQAPSKQLVSDADHYTIIVTDQEIGDWPKHQF
jgi:hypothetical protein